MLNPGNGSAPKQNATVDIEVEVTTTLVRLSIRDTGTGFDPESLPDPTKVENLYIPNGRGVYLIRTLADDVTFDSSSDGTTVSVIFRRG